MKTIDRMQRDYNFYLRFQDWRKRKEKIVKSLEFENLARELGMTMQNLYQIEAKVKSKLESYEKLFKNNK